MRRQKLLGFTLIELLTVIVIIFILAGLVLSVSRFVTNKGKMSRARAEIEAMSAAAESYKADNGVYPDDGTFSGTYTAGAAATLDPRNSAMGNPTATNYYSASLVLYRALSGDTNCDGVVNSTDQTFTVSGSSQTATGVNPTAYYPFKPTQVITSGSTVKALKDPWGYSYGYSTAYAADISNGIASPTHGYNPTFDLWTTAGGTAPSGSNTFSQYQQTWITNW